MATAAPTTDTRTDAWRFKPGVRAVVVDDAGRILLLLRPEREELFGGYWNLPGGGKEEGESFLDGARRELAEETGLDATPTGAGMVFHFPGGMGRAYLMRHPVGALRVAEREAVEARWFYPHELPAKLMPPTTEIVRALAGSSEPTDEGQGLMDELTLTAERLRLEADSATAIAPWLAAHVRRLAREKALIKSLGASLGQITWEPARRPALLIKAQLMFDLGKPKRPRPPTSHIGKEPEGAGRPFPLMDYTGTDEEGEEVLFKTLERAAKLGRAEAARAILSDAKSGKLPEGRTQGYRDKTTARLRAIARRNVRLIRSTTERRLAAIALQAEAADVATLLTKLYDYSRTTLIARDTVAGGYVRGVADVLREHGYRYIFNRTMADDKVCKVCRPLEGRRYTLLQYLATFPIHPMCRCYPHPSPTEAPEPFNWRSKNTAKVVKSLKEAPMKHQTALLALRVMTGEVCGDRQLLIKSLAAGEVPPPAGYVPPPPSADELIKGLQALAAKPKPSTAVGKVDDPSEAKDAGKTPAPDMPSQTDPNYPTEMRQMAEQLLDAARRAPAGSDEHKRLTAQYHMVREALRAWHKSKSPHAQGPALRGPDVKLPPVPSFVQGGAAALASPRQFEIAVAQAKTREDAMALGHYFDALHRKGNHAGPDWDAAWNEIKEAIKHLPSKDGDAPVVQKHAQATAPVGEDEHGTLEKKKDPAGRGKSPLPGDPGYGDHFAARVKASYQADQEEAKARKEQAKPAPKPAKPKAKPAESKEKPADKPKAEKKPEAKPESKKAGTSERPKADQPKALSPEAKAMLGEHKRLIHVLETPSRADDKAEAQRQNKEMKDKYGVDLLAAEKDRPKKGGKHRFGDLRFRGGAT